MKGSQKLHQLKSGENCSGLFPSPFQASFWGSRELVGGSAIILIIKIIVVTMHRTFTVHPWGNTAG